MPLSNWPPENQGSKGKKSPRIAMAIFLPAFGLIVAGFLCYKTKRISQAQVMYLSGFPLFSCIGMIVVWWPLSLQNAPFYPILERLFSDRTTSSFLFDVLRLSWSLASSDWCCRLFALAWVWCTCGTNSTNDTSNNNWTDNRNSSSNCKRSIE